MPRRSRPRGEIFHVIVRGNGKQILFEDDSDYRKFLALLRRYRDEEGVTVIAYCLMENHVHLLVGDANGAVSAFMQKLEGGYARYFNRKYDRIGHLFQNRFKSEVVDNETYFLTVFRYILRNPEKAGIAKASRYPWSSYSEYGRAGGLTDSSLLHAIIGDGAAFSVYMSMEDAAECMEAEPRIRSDAWAIERIREVCDVPSGTALQQLPRKLRNEALIQLRSEGITVRQLERLTGINRGIIQKVSVGQVH